MCRPATLVAVGRPSALDGEQHIELGAVRCPDDVGGLVDGQAGAQPAGGLEVPSQLAHVGGAPVADLLPDLFRFGLGRRGVTQREQQRCHALLDPPHGCGVDGELSHRVGFGQDRLDVWSAALTRGPFGSWGRWLVPSPVTGGRRASPCFPSPSPPPICGDCECAAPEAPPSPPVARDRHCRQPATGASKQSAVVGTSPVTNEATRPP